MVNLSPSVAGVPVRTTVSGFSPAVVRSNSLALGGMWSRRAWCSVTGRNSLSAAILICYNLFSPFQGKNGLSPLDFSKSFVILLVWGEPSRKAVPRPVIPLTLYHRLTFVKWIVKCFYNMSVERQIKLSEKPLGRIMLHLLCLNLDFHFLLHVSGIIRELWRKAWHC